jgi:FSR family fosmidomycin resistance protein-like MFS transporter
MRIDRAPLDPATPRGVAAPTAAAYRLPLLLGLAHGISDAAAGFILGGLAIDLPLAQVGLLALAYNLLAFGTQPLIGVVVDRLQRPRLAVTAGLLAMSGALLVVLFQPMVAVLLAGLGSALLHVGGGALALCATPRRAAGPGLFAAPGVLGLALGSALALAQTPAGPALAAVLLALAAAVLSHPLPVLPYHRASAARPLLEVHDWVLMGLLAAIAVRSAAWTALRATQEGQTEVLIGLACAAAVGKVAGGFLADRYGWRAWSLATLTGAALLLLLGAGIPAMLYVGVALLQSSTPGLVVAFAQAMPTAPATAAGLAFGLAIALGGVPALMGAAPLLSTPAWIAALALVAAALVGLAGRNRSPALTEPPPASLPPATPTSTMEA